MPNQNYRREADALGQFGQFGGRFVPGRTGGGRFFLCRFQRGVRLAVFGRHRCQSLFGTRQGSPCLV